jgi:hypothetical protein
VVLFLLLNFDKYSLFKFFYIHTKNNNITNFTTTEKNFWGN